MNPIGKNFSKNLVTELGLFPKEWKVIRLEEVAKIKYGKAKPKNKGKIPVYGSGGIYDKVDKALVNYPTLIIGRKGSAGRVWLAREPCWASDTTFFLEWKKELDVSFVYYYFLFNPLSGKHVKTTLPSIQVSELEQYKIPLPPLPEQKAIAGVLKTIQDAIEATERVIAAAKELKKSLMRHLFTYGPVSVSERDRVRLKQTEIGPIPEDWEVVRLGEVVDIENGYAFKSEDYVDEGILNFRVINIVENGKIDVSKDCKYLPYEFAKKYAKYLLNAGDIILVMVGATRGKLVLISEDILPALLNQNMWRLKPKDKNLNNIYFYFYLLHEMPLFTRKLSEEARGFFKKKELKNLPIPLPPLPVQQKIAQILKAVDDKISAEEKKKEALQALFKTMLHHLMTGKIRVRRE